MSADVVVKNTFSVLPLLAIVIPSVAALLTQIFGDHNENVRHIIPVVAAATTVGITVTIAMQVMGGSPLYFELKLIDIGQGLSLSLMVDAMGAFFALIAAILWVAVMAYTSTYMYHHQKRTRFSTFMMIAESTTLGIFMVHDYFSLFVFFELMTFSAYMLIIHQETENARRAANKYLIMTLIGGLSLFAGILFYSNYSGTPDFIPKIDSTFLNSPFKLIAPICMMIGFGVKAGIVPLHVWLPDAHPVAPSPASALLSGIMIKVGAYGILRTINSYYYASSGGILAEQSSLTLFDSSGNLFTNPHSLGFVIIWIAIVTIFTGMILAIVQNNIKRMLAYSSISQMGFILLAIGCLAYSGREGAFGLAGSLYHIMNHAFIKACLFMAAGAVHYHTNELNIFKLGGLWRKMPLITIFWCVAVLGMMGIPFFNGFASKYLIHHAIVDARFLASQPVISQESWLQIVEILYIVACGGTIFYLLKMTYYIFFHGATEDNAPYLNNARGAPSWMLVGIGLLAVGVLVTGLMPNIFLKYLIIPAIGIFKGLDPNEVKELSSLTVISWANIEEIFLPLAIGVGAFVVGVSCGLFRAENEKHFPFNLRIPLWFSMDYWYIRSARAFISTCYLCQRFYVWTKPASINIIQKGTRGWRGIIGRKSFARFIVEYSGDIALGPMVIVSCLAIFLVAALLH